MDQVFDEKAISTHESRLYNSVSHMVLLMSSNVLSFAEESCWRGDQWRSVRREIHFVVAGHAIQSGVAIRHEFAADFGLWYDEDDEWLLQILKEIYPAIEWGYFVYFKKIDHSAIMIIDPDSDQIVGSIYPRGRTKRKLSGENQTANIVSIKEFREKKLAEWVRQNSDAFIYPSPAPERDPEE